MLGLQITFCRIDFRKGLGCHGAAILGSVELRRLFSKFCPSFIYTTGLSPHSVATILLLISIKKQDSVPF
jgi:8-amino-7-oxononanoate synthase